MSEAAEPVVAPPTPIEAIRSRYSEDRGWILLTEVQFDGRQMDALAFGLYSSHGYPLHGFEVKSDRGDWLREIENPAKSGPLVERVDAYWLVAPREIVKPEEIPEGWGWYSLNAGGRMKKERTPAKRRPTLDRSDLARLLLRMRKEYGLDAFGRHRLQYQIRQEVMEECRAEARREVEDPHGIVTKYRNLSEQVEAFERASGIDITSEWPLPPAKYGEGIRAVLEDPNSAMSNLEGALRSIEGAAASTKDALREMAKIKGIGGKE